MIYLACALFALSGWIGGSAFGPRWLWALARRWRRSHPQKTYRPRHELPEAAAGGGEPAPALGVVEEGKLAGLVAQFGGIDDEIGPELGGLVADHLRLSSLALTDIELTRLQLAVIDGLHEAAKRDPELLQDPGYTGALAVAVNAVFELSALYRAAV